MSTRNTPARLAIKAAAANTLRYRPLSEGFNSAAERLQANIHFTANGHANRKVDLVVWEIELVSFWFLACRAIDLVESVDKKLKENSYRVSAKRIQQIVATMHPNITLGRKARLGIRHIVRYCRREEHEKIPAVVLDVFKARQAGSVVRPKGKVTIVEYAKLFLKTIAPALYEAGEHFSFGQFLTWIGVDIDGSSPDHIDSKTIGEVRRLFMHFVLDRYKATIEHYIDDAGEEAQSILDTLEATKDGVQSELRPAAYASVKGFLSDISTIQKKVKGIEATKLRKFRKKVQALGFTLMQFQPRINSGSVWTTLAILAEYLGVEVTEAKGAKSNLLRRLKRPSKSLDLTEFAKWITAELAAEEPIDRKAQLITTRWVMDVFEGWRDLRDRTGGLDSAVVAEAHDRFDIRATRMLFSVNKLETVRIIPLMEDPAGTEPRAVRACTEEAEIEAMLGCSDTPRWTGLFAGWTRLMRGANTIIQMGKKLYIGQASHPARGGYGDDFNLFWQAMGCPESWTRLMQGDDLFWATISPEVTLYYLQPRTRKAKKVEIPKLLLKIEQETRAEFETLIGDNSFNRLFNLLKGLTSEIIISARPGSRGKGGTATAEGGWEFGRAIGSIQLCLVIFAWYAHLFGLGKVLSKYSTELGNLFEEDNPHVKFLMSRIRHMLAEMDISVIANVGEGILDDETIEMISDDYNLLCKAYRKITGEFNYRQYDPPSIIREFRDQAIIIIREGFNALPDDATELTLERTDRELLAALMHAILSNHRTSG